VLSTGAAPGGTVTTMFTSDGAAIIAVRQGNYPQVFTGGLRSDITGRGLGAPRQATFSARLASSSQLYTAWQTETALALRVPVGSLRGGYGTAIVLVTGGVQVATLTQAVSFDLISGFSSVALANTPSGGSRLHVMAGGFLGVKESSPAARVGGCDPLGRGGPCGGTGCELSRWTSDSLIICKSARGFMGSHRFMATLGVVGSGTISRAFSVDVHSVFTAAFPNVSTPVPIGTWVTFSGVSLEWSIISRVGMTPCRATRWFSDSSLECKLASGLYNASSVVALTSYGVTSTLSNSFTYDTPLYVEMDYTHGIYYENLAAAGNSTNLEAIARRLPFTEQFILMDESINIVEVAMSRAGQSFDKPTNVSVALLAIPGFMISTVIGQRYRRGFGIAIQSFKWPPQNVEAGRPVSATLKIIQVNGSTLDDGSPVIINLTGFPMNATGGDNATTAQRRSSRRALNNCVGGVEWRMARVTDAAPAVCRCQANTICSDGTSCTLSPIVNNSWVVAEPLTSLCSDTMPLGLIVGLTLGLVLPLLCGVGYWLLVRSGKVRGRHDRIFGLRPSKAKGAAAIPAPEEESSDDDEDVVPGTWREVETDEPRIGPPLGGRSFVSGELAYAPPVVASSEEPVMYPEARWT